MRIRCSLAWKPREGSAWRLFRVFPDIRKVRLFVSPEVNYLILRTFVSRLWVISFLVIDRESLLGMSVQLPTENMNQ